MVGRTTGAVLIGLDARRVQVEVDLAPGLPTIAAVGLPDSAVREGIDRIRSALTNSGFKLPERRIVVNLAPADLRKHGSTLDLPIAAALLEADGKLQPTERTNTLLVGELSLDGAVRPVSGVLSITMMAEEAGYRRVVVPEANADEATLVDGIDVIGVSTLADLVALNRGLYCVRTRMAASELLSTGNTLGGPDLAEVRGQAGARRALEVAASGGHHLLLCGPPGAGKSMLSSRLPGILPPLNAGEALTVTRIWSAAGLSRGLVTRRPFRAPHHQISYAGMTGGGTRLRPGEITLACHGVLYLDELTEFRRDSLESLRQPLEEGTIRITRVHASVVFPASFTLVASMNPCPCGYYGNPDGRCGCSPMQIRRYRAKLSGPLLDRFDLVVRVPPVDLALLASSAPVETSQSVRRRVVEARNRQRTRLGTDGPSCNARMGSADLARFATLGRSSRKRLLTAGERFGMTARGFDRVRRVARTLADLEGSPKISDNHVAEALQYRHPDLPGGD
jgi:magnesium chelatase family protein